MKVFILDVDGVLTNGQFFYTDKGKVMKIFGPDGSQIKYQMRSRMDQNGFVPRRRSVHDGISDSQLAGLV